MYPSWEVESLDIAEFYLEDMPTFDLVLIGAPTWNTGQMQKDWEAIFDEFDTLDLSGIPVALFGPGDQVGYPDTFADALAFFADKVRERGARLIGRWSVADDPAGYSFAASWALEDGSFVGLVLDEINQPSATESRLRLWLDQLWRELPEWHNS
jgi:flavodoxin I